jgi:hypothetical protein
MKIKRMPVGYGHLVVLLLLAGSPAILQNYAQGQAAVGNKAVYGVGGVVSPSQVWIDATAFCGAGGCSGSSFDFCRTLNLALQQLPTQGAIVDARGIVPSGTAPVSQNCGGNPWGSPYTTITKPSLVLLPASAILITATWTLPNNTKISGEGLNTLLKAVDPFTGTAMISMGSLDSCPSEGCSGVAVEHLFLSDQTNSMQGSLNGIVNNYSQTPSYVNDVKLINIKQTGLLVGGFGPGAIDSGPYSNINFTASSCGLNTCPVCADIEAQTRGLHSITCFGATSVMSGTAAIYVNASNNTVEDVHVENYWDGIEIGNIASLSVSNVFVSSVVGGSHGGCNNGCDTNVQNLVHVCGPSGTCQNKPTSVSDVTILQAQYSTSPPQGAALVQDDMTGTSVPAPSMPSFEAMYALGEEVAVGGGFPGFSGFNTSPGSANGGNTTGTTWGVGSASAIGTTCTTPGALYSNTLGAADSAVLVCTRSSPSGLSWQPIP